MSYTDKDCCGSQGKRCSKWRKYYVPRPTVENKTLEKLQKSGEACKMQELGMKESNGRELNRIKYPQSLVFHINKLESLLQ